MSSDEQYPGCAYCGGKVDDTFGYLYGGRWYCNPNHASMRTAFIDGERAATERIVKWLRETCIPFSRRNHHCDVAPGSSYWLGAANETEVNALAIERNDHITQEEQSHE